MVTTNEKSQVLAWLSEMEASEQCELLAVPFIDAAAVLSTFNPTTLNPLPGIEDKNYEEALSELLNCSWPVGTTDDDLWKLDEDTRRTALRRLGSRRNMRRARKANPAPSTDPIQAGLDLLMDNRTEPDLGNMTLDQLLGIERASRWLADILEDLPDYSRLERLIERERLFTPMRRIAGEHFVGRKKELQELSNYVGVLASKSISQSIKRTYSSLLYTLTDRPPMLIYGPGGVGKSTLLMRFILLHADPKFSQPLPFAYLDFDHAALDPRSPQTILNEAIRQIGIQFPKIAARFGRLEDESFEDISNSDIVESAKSAHYGLSQRLVTRFSKLLEAIANQNKQPVLFVLDTLEEAEYQGQTALKAIWNLLDRLLRNVDRLRIVVCGRSQLPPKLPKNPVELTAFDDETAKHFLISRIELLSGKSIRDKDAEAIVHLVGGVPLGLSLAARVVSDEGVEVIKDLPSRRHLFQRISTERQQGLLYSRILQHLHKNDKDLEKIASPGLIVRRITPEVIINVLAKPCELSLATPDDAVRLFNLLAKEVGLIDAYREPGALWHATTVRRLMLPELRKNLGSRATDIHKAAIGYYSNESGTVARAEEIYHRLCMGDMGPEIDHLWTPEMKSHLRGAFEDLDTRGKIWLAGKIGRELDTDLLAQSELAVWEQQTQERVQTLINNRMLEEALDAMTERSKRSDASPLYPLEVDVLQLLGKVTQAREIAETGIARAEKAGDRKAVLVLLSRLISITEREEKFNDAITYALDAYDIARSLQDDVETVSAGIALVRLRRKTTEQDSNNSGREKAMSEQLLSKYDPVLDSYLRTFLENNRLRRKLRSRPALLRECAAEFGGDVPPLITETVRQLGISAADLLALEMYVEDMTLKLSAEQKFHLKKVLEAKTSRGIGRDIAPISSVIGDFLADRYKQSVENNLHQTIQSLSAKKRDDIKLTSKQLSELEAILSKLLTNKQLGILLSDYFDIAMNIIVPIIPAAGIIPPILKYFRKEGLLSELLSVIDQSLHKDNEVKKFVDRIRKP